MVAAADPVRRRAVHAGGVQHRVLVQQLHECAGGHVGAELGDHHAQAGGRISGQRRARAPGQCHRVGPRVVVHVVRRAERRVGRDEQPTQVLRGGVKVRALAKAAGCHQLGRQRAARRRSAEDDACRPPSAKPMPATRPISSTAARTPSTSARRGGPPSTTPPAAVTRRICREGGGHCGCDLRSGRPLQLAARAASSRPSASSRGGSARVMAAPPHPAARAAGPSPATGATSRCRVARSAPLPSRPHPARRTSACQAPGGRPG